MRLVSLIILLLIIGAIAFVFIHEPTRTKVFAKVKEWRFQTNGYSMAKTPREAAELFTKAIKAREYEAAARYCSGEYAELLIKAHEPAREMGTRLDKIYNIIHEKDLRTPMAIELLLGMDPFADTFKIKEVKEGGKGEGAVVYFVSEPKPPATGKSMTVIDKGRLDHKIFEANPLVPGNGPNEFFRTLGFNIKKDKDDNWKIDFPANKEVVMNFIGLHKRYLPTLDGYHDDLLRDATMQVRDRIGTDLLERLVSASK